MEGIAGMQQARDELSLEYVDMRDVGDGYVGSVVPALKFEHKLFLREMNGELLPRQIPLPDVQVAMDFICGSGSWCIDFCKQYPEKRLYGVDINPVIMNHAWEDASQAGVNNLELLVVDRARPLPFPDHSFDFVRLQNGTSFFPMEQWPAVMREIARVLRPGGWLNLVDFEMGPASQPAIERVLTFLSQILARLHRSSDLNGSAPFTGSTLGPQRMAELGFTQVAYRLYPVDLGGWNNPAGRAYLAWSVIRPQMISYLAEKTGISTGQALQPLLREVQRELRQIDFCGFGMLLSSFGRKPTVE